jgi:integrase/recombinase XerD
MARKKLSWPRIAHRKNKNGEVTSYFVDLGYLEKDGITKRTRSAAFKTLAEAEGAADLYRITRRNEGTKALTFAAGDRSDAERALALLGPHKVTLLQAAEFYIQNVAVIKEAKPVESVIEELLTAKEKDGRADRYLRDLKARLTVFGRAFAGRPLYSITEDELDVWLRSLDSGPANRNNYRRVISVAFGFAVKKRYAMKNPVAHVEVANVKVEKPGILTVDEARALLQTANPDFVPVVALGLFAGLRPESEVWRLNWKNIDLEERVIDVENSKNTASHRFVRISDNLLAWLKPHAKKSGPLTLHDEPYFRRMRETRERAADRLDQAEIPADNLRDWPADCLRHTFASCHYAAFKNAADTAEQLGHGGNLRMFFRHYRGRVKQAEAQAFWQIVPTA